MTDIFGNRISDYTHLEAIRQKHGIEGVQAYLKDRDERNALLSDGYKDIPMHDFNAISPGLGTRNPNWRADGDAGSFGFVTDNLAAIQTMVDEIMVAGARYQQFVPVITGEIDPGAKTYEIMTRDYEGEGAAIAPDASDIPTVRAIEDTRPQKLSLRGIAVTYTDEEIDNARFSGFPLDALKTRAALDGAAQDLDKIALVGKDDMPVKTGLINLPIGANDVNSVQHSVQASDKTIADMTPLELIEFLQAQTRKMVAYSEEIIPRQLRGPLSIYLPIEQMHKLSDTPTSDDANRSCWEYYSQNNAWTAMMASTGAGRISPELHAISELKGAGTNNKDRCIFTLRDRQIFQMQIARAVTQMDTQRVGLATKVFFVYKVGPLDVLRPTLIWYIDNV